MQDQQCRTIFILFGQVVVSLVLFVPLTGNAGSPVGSTSVHRGLHLNSPGIHRGLNRTQAMSIPSHQEHRNIQQRAIGYRGLNRTRGQHHKPDLHQQPHKHTGESKHKNSRHKHSRFIGNVSVRSFGKPVKHRLHHDHHKKFRDHKRHVHHTPVKHHRHFGLIFYQPIKHYDSRSINYPGYSAYDHPGYSPAEDKYPVEPVPVYGIDSAGWSLLSRGQIQAALNIFDRDMKDHATAGIPKAGFALAVAASGDLTKGILAMREAFRMNPDALQYLEFDARLLALIHVLIKKYEYPLQSGNQYPDEAFMVSALNYLKGDFIAAHHALGLAIAYGDKSQDLGNLHRLIYVQLQGDYAGEYNY